MNLPQRLAPAFRDYLWGGTRLHDDFGKSCSLDKIAESWELSCHEDGPSHIEGTDMTLSEYIAAEGSSVLGTNCSRFNDFPVLVKLIDAHDDLSVQVHPDDDYAQKHEGGYGKTEMWYVLDCEEGAALLYGFSSDITAEEFSESIENGTFLDRVKIVPVKKGDVFFIEAGTLHAIGKGIVIAEIQQNSNTTYRIYDYDRTDSSGSKRPLHISQAFDVINFSPAPAQKVYEPVMYSGYSSKLLASCRYFTVHLLDISSEAQLETDTTSFEHFLVAEGSGELTGEGCTMKLSKGDSIFIPAGYGRYTVTGTCLIIKTRID